MANALERARAWMFDIYAHHTAERHRIHRAVMRKQMGVEDQQDIPYPGAVSDSNNPKTTINVGTGWLRGALLGAALTAGSAGGVAGLIQYLKPGNSPVPTPATAVAKEPSPPSPPPAGKDPAWDAIYEIQQPDGTWKQVKRERLKPK